MVWYEGENKRWSLPLLHTFSSPKPRCAVVWNLTIILREILNKTMHAKGEYKTDIFIFVVKWFLISSYRATHLYNGKPRFADGGWVPPVTISWPCPEPRRTLLSQSSPPPFWTSIPTDKDARRRIPLSVPPSTALVNPWRAVGRLSSEGEFPIPRKSSETTSSVTINYQYNTSRPRSEDTFYDLSWN